MSAAATAAPGASPFNHQTSFHTAPPCRSLLPWGGPARAAGTEIQVACVVSAPGDARRAMFVPMPIPPPAPVPAYFYNKYEKLDPETEANQFAASDGIYRATDLVSLAYPAPHPSEPVANPNPLTPQAAPLHSGTHLSVLSLSDVRDLKPVRTRSQGEVPAMDPVEHEHSNVDDDSSSSGDSVEHAIGSQPQTPGFLSPEFHRGSSASTGCDLSASLSASFSASIAMGNSVFDNVYEGPAKRKRRTGTSANGTTSTFVSRAIADPNMSARLNDHKPEDYFIFGNVGRALSWIDLGAPAQVRHEPLSKLMFSLATVTCHDVNHHTKSLRYIDVVIGTNTGDIVWYDPVACRYVRYNKQRCTNSSAVTQIQWLPGSDHLFMAAHADGALVLYDTVRDDGDLAATLATNSSLYGEHEYFPQQANTTAMAVLKSSSDPRNKSNPVSYFSLSRQAINAFAFSPDQTHLACVSDDGCLKVIDFRREKLLDVYSSYYGGLTCVAWSPDGHYMVTGGKDDLVTIWSFVERRIVARCHGHSSFITGVVFDEFMCDELSYRFGSISEDGKLCLWDFALSSLHKPSSKVAKSGALQMPDEAERPIISSAQDSRPISNVKDGVAYHRVESRLSTAILSPITVKQVDDQPPSHLIFLKDHIIIATTGKKYGHIIHWKRP